MGRNMYVIKRELICTLPLFIGCTLFPCEFVLDYHAPRNNTLANVRENRVGDSEGNVLAKISIGYCKLV